MLDPQARPGRVPRSRILFNEYTVGGLLALLIVLVVMAFLMPWDEMRDGAAAWGW